jgi:hypothetical protein
MNYFLDVKQGPSTGKSMKKSQSAFLIAFLLIAMASPGNLLARCQWENMMVLYKCQYNLGWLKDADDAYDVAVKEFYEWFARLTPKKVGERPALMIEFTKSGKTVIHYKLASWQIIDLIPERMQRVPSSEIRRNKDRYMEAIKKHTKKL